MRHKGISVIIPTFNEKEHIPITLNELIVSLDKNNLDFEIIVVDDGSRDGTIEIVKSYSKKDSRIKLMIRNTKPGFGYSLIDGTKQASKELVVWVMGDASDDFDTIPKMIDRINKGSDIVVGFDFISITSWKYRQLGRERHKAFLAPPGNEKPILAIEDMALKSIKNNIGRVIVAPIFVEDGNGAPVTVFADI